MVAASESTASESTVSTSAVSEASRHEVEVDAVSAMVDPAPVSAPDPESLARESAQPARAVVKQAHADDAYRHGFFLTAVINIAIAAAFAVFVSSIGYLLGQWLDDGRPRVVLDKPLVQEQADYSALQGVGVISGAGKPDVAARPGPPVYQGESGPGSAGFSLKLADWRETAMVDGEGQEQGKMLTLFSVDAARATSDVGIAAGSVASVATYDPDYDPDADAGEAAGMVAKANAAPASSGLFNPSSPSYGVIELIGDQDGVRALFAVTGKTLPCTSGCSVTFEFDGVERVRYQGEAVNFDGENRIELEQASEFATRMATASEVRAVVDAGGGEHAEVLFQPNSIMPSLY